MLLWKEQWRLMVCGLGRLDLQGAGLGRGRGLGRGCGLGWCWSLLNSWSLGRGLFRRGRCSLASRDRFRGGPDFRHGRAFSFVIYVGALVACADIFSCAGVVGGRAGVWGFLVGSGVHMDIRSRRFLLSPRVHVDVGGRDILFRRRIVLRRGGGLVRRRQRCRRRGGRVTSRWYVGGGSFRRLGNLRAATRARSLFRCKRSPEREKTLSQ
jgi:hypothetical protein